MVASILGVLARAWFNPPTQKPKTCKEIVSQAMAKHVKEYHSPDTYLQQFKKFKLDWDKIDAEINAAIERAYEETNRSLPYRPLP